ncbi:biotin carboxylase-like protein [Deinococcus aerius]|uniref:Biotin carboxylase-like protein n=1 Tax=Deinococcus aerius TaxID=200253 RepID=A0A2I9CSR3_9DEIO|nr:ATP-grasp domain-containing protein [Deinococcus aerius]GBF04724.1 biotin carboxylase-like protein [Deinococcus aerius]
MTRPRLLVLGGRAGLIRACARLGVFVTAYSVEPGQAVLAPGQAGRVVEGESLSNAERIAYNLLRYDERSFDGVTTGYEEGIFSAAVLQALYGTARREVLATAVAFRDKREQKLRLGGCVEHAAIWLLPALHAAALPREARYPLVVKPADGVATAHTYVVHDDEELDEVARRVRDAGIDARGTFVVESFVDGEEWHVNGWTSGGRLQWFSASRYRAPLIRTKDGVVVSSVTLRPADHPDTFARLHEFTARALSGLDLSDGVFHLECFWRGDAFVFSECAARIGGGYVAETIRHMFGVDLYEVAVRLALGEHVAAPDVAQASASHGYLQLPAPDEPVTYVPTVADLLALPGVVEAEYDFRSGNVRPDVRRNSSARAGKVVVHADGERELEQALDAVLAYARSPHPVADV